MKLPTLDFLKQRKAAILGDLKFKVEVEDWHGVQDCASDLREIEAKAEVLLSNNNKCVHEAISSDGQMPQSDEDRRRQVEKFV